MATKRRGGRPRMYGDRWLDSRGYVMVRVGDVVMPEHRLVMMAVLGRPLRRAEVVRHRNDVKTDNRPENLDLRIGAVKPGARAEDLVCPHCGGRYIDPPTELAMDLDEVRRKIASREWQP